VRSRTRSEELVAISETIKVLNDDDALELFKKTLPGASSFVQVSDTSAQRSKALKILGSLRKPQGAEPRLDFLTLCMQGKKVGFEKVIKMIDDMTAELKKEQVDDSDSDERVSKGAAGIGNISARGQPLFRFRFEFITEVRLQVSNQSFSAIQNVI